MRLFDLSGKVAVVTGGSKGIGRAICLAMAEHGASVVVSSRKLDACEEVASGIRARGGEAFAMACHIGRKEELQKLVDETQARWGRIDILVCNAAVNPYFGASVGMPDDAYNRIMDSNVRSNFWLCNMVAPGMAQRGDGSIIIVSSIGGFQGSDDLDCDIDSIREPSKIFGCLREILLGHMTRLVECENEFCPILDGMVSPRHLRPSTVIRTRRRNHRSP